MSRIGSSISALTQQAAIKALVRALEEADLPLFAQTTRSMMSICVCVHGRPRRRNRKQERLTWRHEMSYSKLGGPSRCYTVSTSTSFTRRNETGHRDQRGPVNHGIAHHCNNCATERCARGIDVHYDVPQLLLDGPRRISFLSRQTCS